MLTTDGPVARASGEPPRIAALPWRAEPIEDAIRAGGAIPVDPDEAEAIVWLDPSGPGNLGEVLEGRDDIRWVQLPFAGVEPFAEVFDHDRMWTCGKGAYAEPVAEHAFAMMLAGLRQLVPYAKRRSWSPDAGRNLLGAHVTILGGGEITRSLLRMLEPFDCDVTVVRRRPDALPGARVVGTDGIDDALRDADVVVLALALTPETIGILDARRLALLPSHAWVVNVARGRHIDTDALVEALAQGRLGGAALDVTEPEPLPDGHPLWDFENVVITPHTANTKAMGLALLTARVTENVRRYAVGEPLIGPVDVTLGY